MCEQQRHAGNGQNDSAGSQSGLPPGRNLPAPAAIRLQGQLRQGGDGKQPGEGRQVAPPPETSAAGVLGRNGRRAAHSPTRLPSGRLDGKVGIKIAPGRLTNKSRVRRIRASVSAVWIGIPASSEKMYVTESSRRPRPLIDTGMRVTK